MLQFNSFNVGNSEKDLVLIEKRFLSICEFWVSILRHGEVMPALKELNYEVEWSFDRMQCVCVINHLCTNIEINVSLNLNNFTSA